MSCIRRHRNRGSTLIEFAVTSFLLMLIIFACIEFGRMLLVANSVANAARVGCRYAITHGTDNPTTLASIQSVVTDFAASAPLNTSNLTVTVNPTPPLGSPGSTVSVTVSYPYDPFTVLPLSVTFRSTSEGIITF